MGKDFVAVWLGDDDPSQQVAEVGGLSFVKGEKVAVPADHPMAEKIRGNPMFSVEGKAEPIQSEEPEPADPDAGTELAAAKAEAERLHVKLGPGNHKVETIRAKIAEHLKNA